LPQTAKMRFRCAANNNRYFSCVVGHVLNIPTKFHQDRPVFKKDIGLKPFVTLIHRKSSMFKNPQKVSSTSQSDAALARSLQSVSREAVLKRSTCGESFMGFTPERTERTLPKYANARFSALHTNRVLRFE
jgi:hypothetical protein